MAPCLRRLTASQSERNAKVCKNITPNDAHYNLFCCEVLPFEKVYLENLPCAEMYEKSYMHRDVITHVLTTKYVP